MAHHGNPTAARPASLTRGRLHAIDWAALVLGVGIILGQVGSCARMHEIKEVVDRNAQIVKAVGQSVDADIVISNENRKTVQNIQKAVEQRDQKIEHVQADVTAIKQRVVGN